MDLKVGSLRTLLALMHEPPVDFSAISFVLARSDQQELVERVLRRAFEPYAQKLGRELTNDAFAWLGTALRNGNVHIGLEHDAIVGVVATSHLGKVLTIERMAVLPERQGSGIGTRLLAEIEAFAREQAFESITLYTAAKMDDLLRLYRRHGFREVRRGPPPHGKDPYPRVFLEKSLQ